jgi:hypothetical protein
MLQRMALLEKRDVERWWCRKHKGCPRLCLRSWWWRWSSSGASAVPRQLAPLRRRQGAGVCDGDDGRHLHQQAHEEHEARHKQRAAVCRFDLILDLPAEVHARRHGATIRRGCRCVFMWFILLAACGLVTRTHCSRPSGSSRTLDRPWYQSLCTTVAPNQRQSSITSHQQVYHASVVLTTGDSSSSCWSLTRGRCRARAVGRGTITTRRRRLSSPPSTAATVLTTAPLTALP